MKRLSGFAVALAALALAPAAHATFVFELVYERPVIELFDQYKHGTQEDLAITKDGPAYVFTNPGIAEYQGPHDCDPPNSYTNELRCPVAGIETIVAKLGARDDRASIGLGTRARRVEQRLNGGPGEDVLRGGRAKQRLRGGADADVLRGRAGNDVLRGGPGPDLLVGGPGEDICIGGGGADVLRRC